METLIDFCANNNIDCRNKDLKQLYKIVFRELRREIDLYIGGGTNQQIDKDWIDIIYVLYPTLIKKLSKRCLEPKILEINLNNGTCIPECKHYLDNLQCENGIIMVRLIDPKQNYKHQVLLFTDKKTQTIEYFDSVGDTYGLDILKPYLQKQWSIITTLNYCPKIKSPQHQTQDIYCASWSLLYLYLRSKYISLPIQDIWNILISLSSDQLASLIKGFILSIINFIRKLNPDYNLIRYIVSSKNDLQMYSYNLFLSK